ncbi:MAG TPA: hypothetical protein VGT02_18055 [Methylomirabilota bacterium]|jgi:hypothetical protein|nr:hypothetical protein [Methylomirabilota bacterium]
MKIVGWTLTLLALACLIAPPPVSAASQSFETPVGGTMSNPCNNEPIAFSGSQRIIVGVTNDGSGGTHLHTHISFQGVSGLGAFGNTYSIPSAQSFNNNIGNATTFTTIVIIRVISRGLAPNFNGQQDFHMTVNANGTVTATPGLFRFNCAG